LGIIANVAWYQWYSCVLLILLYPVTSYPKLVGAFWMKINIFQPDHKSCNNFGIKRKIWHCTRICIQIKHHKSVRKKIWIVPVCPNLSRFVYEYTLRICMKPLMLSMQQPWMSASFVTVLWSLWKIDFLKSFFVNHL